MFSCPALQGGRFPPTEDWTSMRINCNIKSDNIISGGLIYLWL